MEVQCYCTFPEQHFCLKCLFFTPALSCEQHGGSSDVPMSSEQLFASTPIPANLTSQSQAASSFYPRAREEVPPQMTGAIPTSHVYFPYGIPPQQAYEAYNAYAHHPMSAGQLLHKLANQSREFSREENRESGERQAAPSSPPSTVLTLFPGGGK